jgi:hypothetical protein
MARWLLKKGWTKRKAARERRPEFLRVGNRPHSRSAVRRGIDLAPSGLGIGTGAATTDEELTPIPLEFTMFNWKSEWRAVQL